MRTLLVISSLLVPGLLCSTADADFIAINQPTGTIGHQTNGPYALGQNFTVNSPISVTNLLGFDSGGNGFEAPVQISIFSNATQSVVPGLSASLTTANTSPVSGSAFRALNSFTPVTLAPGSYMVVGSNFGAGPNVETNTNTNESNGSGGKDPVPAYDNGGGLIAINVGSNAYTTTLNAYPTNADNGQYGAGSFDFVAAPEPASLSMLALGSLGLLSRRRRG